MPVAEFPGDRGWGYDGVDLYAPHHAYGGPEGLKRLVRVSGEDQRAPDSLREKLRQQLQA